MTAENDSPEADHTHSDSPIPVNRIQRQLERILTSPVFQATETQKAFLAFVVKKALAGESGAHRFGSCLVYQKNQGLAADWLQVLFSFTFYAGPLVIRLVRIQWRKCGLAGFLKVSGRCKILSAFHQFEIHLLA
jgi:hypothetical protein